MRQPPSTKPVLSEVGERVGGPLPSSAVPPHHPSRREHRDVGDGALRAAVFGASDGLVSNAALVLGVASSGATPGVVLLSGLAGLLAGAGSMAAGEWSSVTAQREAKEREPFPPLSVRLQPGVRCVIQCMDFKRRRNITD